MRKSLSKFKSLLESEDNIKKPKTIDEFEEVLKQKFVISDKLTSRGFIFPNGKNLELSSYKSHGMVTQWLVENGYVDNTESVWEGGCPPIEDLGCIRTNLDSEGFIMLSKIEPTPIQYDKLLIFFDLFLNRKWSWKFGRELMILTPHQKGDYAKFSVEDKVSDDFVNIIKNYYRIGRLVENIKLNNIEAMYELSRLNEEALSTTDFDSRGNVISPEQKEFFKDSRIKNSAGQLIPMYHGTHKKFNNEVFISPINWFTTNEKYATQYGSWTHKDGKPGHNYKCYLNCTKLLNCGRTDGFIFDETKDKDVFEFSRQFKILFDKLNVSEADMKKIISEVADEYDEKNNGRFMKIHVLTRSDKFKDLTIKQGYDSIRCLEAGVETVGAFYPNQIKSVDNKTPTNNDNINK